MVYVVFNFISFHKGGNFDAIIPRINIDTVYQILFFRVFSLIKIDLDMSSIGSINISYLIKGY